MSETRHIDTIRIHERTGRAKPIKVERRDGTISEVDVVTVVEAVTRKHQIEALADGLPVCECCSKKVAPVDRNPKFKRRVMCTRCPSCTCGNPVGKTTHWRALRDFGRRGMCFSCNIKAAQARASARRLLDDAQAIEIMTRLAAGEAIPAVALRYGVDVHNVAHLWSGQTFKHLESERVRLRAARSVPHHRTEASARHDVGNGVLMSVREIAKSTGLTASCIKGRLGAGLVGADLLDSKTERDAKGRAQMWVTRKRSQPTQKAKRWQKRS